MPKNYACTIYKSLFYSAESSWTLLMYLRSLLGVFRQESSRFHDSFGEEAKQGRYMPDIWRRTVQSKYTGTKWGGLLDNPLSPNIHVQILHAYLHVSSSSSSSSTSTSSSSSSSSNIVQYLVVFRIVGVRRILFTLEKLPSVATDGRKHSLW